tara:strand:- start:67 stop:702 length:636 start_codon:yes stop_codon:yes gene_type:complete
MQTKMNLIFVGPQGSGKGTQAKIISKELGLAHISTGDLLREAKGELKEKVDNYTNRGNLVPDNLILEILKKRLDGDDCKNGFILDGFPRNSEQAKALDKIMKVDKVIEIKISDKEALKRLSGRWICKKCGIAYNVLTSPKPKKDKICDSCNIPLYQREDDKPSPIKKRLKIYHEETEPVLEYYQDKIISINGERSIEEIQEEILKRLKNAN